MKTKLLLAWLLIATCISVQAQTEELEYRPFTRGGMIFETRVGIYKENVYISKIDADTMINGETWRKVYNSIPWAGRMSQSYFAAVRDVGRKVYAIAKGSTRPRLLYDFDLEEDDFVKCGMEGNAFGCLLEQGEPRDMLLGFPLDNYLMVERIDTVRLHDGLTRRRFTLSLCDYFKGSINGPIVWIEGLGSAAGPFSPWMPIPAPSSYFDWDDDIPCQFTSYYLNRDYIGVSYEFDKVESIEIPSAISSFEPTQEGDNLYDLQGRKLSDKPEREIYIESGKKKVK